MNTLEQMGIQQWRRRATANSPAVAMPQAESVPAPDEVLPESPLDSVELSEAAPIAKPESILSWESLEEAISNQAACQHCAAVKPILGAGDQQADYVFITAMPSANDLERQQLLSGRDGLLFDAILSAMSLERNQVYLTSACKCIIADDSVSTRSCVQLIHQQLALLQPQVIVAFDQQAAQWVIKSNENLSVLRNQVQKCHSTNVPVVVTHGLSKMLNQPSLKAEVWKDLKRAIRLLD